MKKLTAFLSALALGLTAAPMTAFAETSDDTAAAEIQMGDVNADGRIDAIDATLTLRYYTLMISDTDPSEIPYYDNIIKYGDMDGNGQIETIDATIALQLYSQRTGEKIEGSINVEKYLEDKGII